MEIGAGKGLNSKASHVRRLFIASKARCGKIILNTFS